DKRQQPFTPAPLVAPEEAAPKETSAESAPTASDDNVPEGISNIFSSLKLKVNVPPKDGESDSSEEGQPSAEEETSQAPLDLPTIKVTLPVSEDNNSPEQKTEEPPAQPAIRLSKPSRSNFKETASPDIAPEFTLAFGLALQTTGFAAYPISLAPMLRRWQIQREDRLKYLVLAVFFLVATIAGSMIAADLWMGARIEELNEGMEELHECDKLVPKLDSAISQIEYQQQLLLPFVELGGRAKTFMQALTVINSAKGKRDWCFYFADQFSYNEHNVPTQKEETKLAPKETPRGDMFGGAPLVSPKEQRPDPKDEQKVVLDTMPLLTSMVMAGFTPVEDNRRYAGVLALQNNLRPPKTKDEQEKRGYETIFNDQVDTMEVAWQGNGINLETGWNQYLRSQKAQLGEFTEFKLILPLARKQVDIPPPKEQPKKAKKK
ncbi:MAG: hypothetical protein IJS15_05515, partial [Victivallales bacterium]|nr:hypothetical protein [Victivallales bacterium]